jgi:hypothetical protein
MKFTTKTVTETIDDNPRFDSAMRMATPAPPAHFLRVFGQPERAGLGEFRDTSSIAAPAAHDAQRPHDP